MVIKNPKRFALTREDIIAAYERYQEKLGIEGQARREILSGLIVRGWIRIRRYPDIGWSVNISHLNTGTASLLVDWARTMLQGSDEFHEHDSYMPVRITGERCCFEVTISELAEGIY